MKFPFNSNILLVLLLGVFAHQAYSICCPWYLNKDAKCQCDDGGLVHPWDCCSEGACNVFCCNCGGPCRVNATDLSWENILPTLENRPRRAIPDEEQGYNRLEDPNRLYHELIASAMHFASIDQDGDQQLSYEETLSYLSKTKKNFAHRFRNPKEAFWFSNMDKNGDGHIQLFEFDEDVQLFESFLGKQ
ncbi:hypothetical protein TCAL_14264 [Tigriopus californicus]|uniref:EF-hand domain-containing protein n=1 Tax=Tigriopus californicus TaxID=6832 RepID=A0A553NUY8_TIGCA|nr:uncharacterized protein LOC131884158 [Tigriopus californicus]TRY69247.1 hypothetical protein TCAL_14264 [Tigriopus californicus]